jgi:hypothetical protein
MECFGTIDFDNNNRLITLSAIIISGLHCMWSGKKISGQKKCSIQEICTEFESWQKRRDTPHSWRNTRMIPWTNVDFCMSTLSNAGHISCHRNFLCPDMMLPGYVSLPQSKNCHLQTAAFFTIRSTKFRC